MQNGNSQPSRAEQIRIEALKIALSTWPNMGMDTAFNIAEQIAIWIGEADADAAKRGRLASNFQGMTRAEAQNKGGEDKSILEGGVEYQEFSASGSWKKPPESVSISVQGVGADGGSGPGGSPGGGAAGGGGSATAMEQIGWLRRYVGTSTDLTIGDRLSLSQSDGWHALVLAFYCKVARDNGLPRPGLIADKLQPVPQDMLGIDSVGCVKRFNDGEWETIKEFPGYRIDKSGLLYWQPGIWPPLSSEI